jgi:AcrR family transcriptional regulator
VHSTSAGQGVRRQAALTPERLVESSRELLVEGGPAAVVVREVARRLGVTAPALYRHVAGRDDLLTLLIASCHDELTAACESAAHAAPDDPELRLRAATWAFRAWALEHRPEFGLLYGTPIVGYSAPQAGPASHSGRRFGQLFGGLFVALQRAGRLRAVPEGALTPPLQAELRRAADRLGLPMGPGHVHAFVVGYQRMLGVVSVEVAGHLSWALSDTEPFVRGQLEDVLTELLLPR